MGCWSSWGGNEIFSSTSSPQSQILSLYSNDGGAFWSNGNEIINGADVRVSM